MITPSGTLIRKIQPHRRCWLITPPSAGPPARASAPAAAQMPMAMVRSRMSVNAATMMASVAGISSAAPTPWTARLAMSTLALPASPAASEERVKTPRPNRNSRGQLAVHVGEPPPDQQQPGQREQVAADHPLQPGHRQVQVALHGRDGHVDDVVVE